MNCQLFNDFTHIAFDMIYKRLLFRYQKASKKANEYNSRKKSGKNCGGQIGHKGQTLNIEKIKEKIASGKLKHEIVDIGNPANAYETRYIVPAYTRTGLTNTLHEQFGFRTDYQLITHSEIKKIIKATKKKHILQNHDVAKAQQMR